MNRLYRVLASCAFLLGVLSVSVSLRADVTSGIVGWWKFNNNAVDSSGSGLNGSVIGSPLYQSGKMYEGISLNGTSGNYVFRSPGPNLANIAFTISAWIKPNQFNNRTFYSIGSTAGTRQAVHLRLESTTSFRFGLYSDDLSVTTMSNMTGAWTHIVVTLDSSNVQRVYQNGVLKATRQAGGKFTGNATQYIGRDAWTSADFYDGLVDDVRVYNRALSGAEVTSVYNAGAADFTPPSAPTNLTATPATYYQNNLSWSASTDANLIEYYKIERCRGTGCSNFAQIATTTSPITTYSDTDIAPSTSYSYRVRATDQVANESSYSSVATVTTIAGSSGPIAWWKFDENTGTVASDSSGNGYNATLLNGVSWASGQSGSAVSLDGANDKITAPSIPLGSAFTFSAWVNNPANGSNEYIVRAAWSKMMLISNGSLYLSGLGTPFGTIPTGSWQNIAIVSDGLTATAYLNGTQLGSPLSLSPSAYIASNTDIGFFDGNGKYVGFSGLLDDLRIYNRPLSAAEVAVVADTTPPSTPTNLAASAISSSQINLSWSAATDNIGVTEYRLERCPGSGCITFSQFATDDASPYSSIGLSASTLYRYRIRAADAAGNVSGYSNIAEATTSTSAPFISSLSPASGRKNTDVTISGSGFGATQGANTVTFNGVVAEPTSWSSSQIITPVPMDATTGPVIVTVGGVGSNAVNFTLILPMIVHLNFPWKPLADLSPTERIAQQQAIIVAQDQLLAELTGTQYTLIQRFGYSAALVLDVGPDALAVLGNSTLVKAVTEDIPVPHLLLQTVGSVASPGLVGAVQAWQAGFDGSGSVVAILDTGVDKNHPFLTGSVLAEACFSQNGNCPNGLAQMTGPGAGVPCTYATQGCKHGTHVAGIVAGQGATFSGVAKGGGLIAIQVFSRFTGAQCTGAGENPCTASWPSDQLLALDYVLRLHADQILSADAVNMSLGRGRFFDQALCDTSNPTMKERIDDLRRFGIPTIIASGNQGWTDSMHAPGCISSAISVGATTKLDGISSFSNSASFLSLVAPGASICSSVPTGTGGAPSCSATADFESFNGTSMAAPHVAGAWAILKRKKPNATVGQILNALQTTGFRIEDIRAGSGRINCRIQVDQALNNIPEKFFNLPIDESAAYGINNCGQIVGTQYVGTASGFITDTKNSYTSVVYNGPIEPGGFYDRTEATSINNKGEVHGHYCCGFWGDQGFKRSTTGTMTEVNNPDTNGIYGNNDSGDLVGQIWNPAPDADNFQLINGITTVITPIFALDVNNMRRISGIKDNGAGGSNGVLRNEQGVETIFQYPPGGANTWASGISEAGYVVGYYYSGNTPINARGFLRKPDGSFELIDYPGADATFPTGINDSGQIVGSYRTGSSMKAFVDLSR